MSASLTVAIRAVRAAVSTAIGARRIKAHLKIHQWKWMNMRKERTWKQKRKRKRKRN